MESQSGHGMIRSMGYFVCEGAGDGGHYIDPEENIGLDEPMTKSEEDQIHVARMQ